MQPKWSVLLVCTIHVFRSPNARITSDEVYKYKQTWDEDGKFNLCRLAYLLTVHCLLSSFAVWCGKSWSSWWRRRVWCTGKVKHTHTHWQATHCSWQADHWQHTLQKKKQFCPVFTKFGVDGGCFSPSVPFSRWFEENLTAWSLSLSLSLSLSSSS